MPPESATASATASATQSPLESLPTGATPSNASRLATDAARLSALARWTARTLDTPHPVPFGAEIVSTLTGARLMRSLNAVARQNDPSAHAELRCVRRACRRLGTFSLRGYTLYTTCEPCPMCMANALWAGLDRVIYGATIADANRFCRQIRIPAAELTARSDMASTEVVGPLCHDQCLALFTHPNMQQTFKTWSSAK